MASVGPSNPGTLANDLTGDGTESWVTPSNATTSNDSRTTVALAGAVGDRSEYLKATNFGFAVPSDATIDGISFEVERSHSGSSTQMYAKEVKLVKGGTIQATDKAEGAAGPFVPSADAYRSYGGSSDLWGTTWTPTDVNASTFGAVVSIHNRLWADTARIDHVRLTVYYTESGGGGGGGGEEEETALTCQTVA